MGYSTRHLQENVRLTTTNGKDAAGTSAGPFHRFVIPVTRGPNVGIQWWSTGAGAVTACKIWISTLPLQDVSKTVPANNRAWFLSPYQFTDAFNVVKIPDGVATQGYLPLRDVSAASLMVELEVSTEISEYNLGWFTGGPA